METGECEVKKTLTGGKRKEVADSRPMYAAIFLFLALSALIFLLRNINILKTRFKSHPASKVTECSPPPPSHHDSSPWSCQDPKLSPEDALEERSLKESIRWPESPHFPKAPNFKQTSDPAHSHFTILPAEGAGEWHVGDRLEALIRMHDFQGQPKLYGGDFLLARLHDPSLEAGVAGQVVDHLNGSYSAVFPLLWEGRAQVEVTLVHPSEAVSVLRRLTREQPGRVFFQSGFRSGKVSENTVCNVCLPPSQQRTLCNYTNLHTGEPWYCYKPNTLSCDDRIDHKRCVHHTNISSEEALLFQSNVNIKIHIHASGIDSIKVQPKKNQAEPEVESSGGKPGPSGYYYQGVWRALTGINVGHFDDTSAISQCLKYKMVHLYGDSTVRQWFEYLNTALPELKEINLNGPPHVGPYMAVDNGRNTMLTYRCHGPPLSFTVVPVSELRYVANELEGLAGGANTVVVISVWAHFDPFPVDVYIERLRGIRRSVARLLRRAPATLVVVRSANPRALDRDMSLTYSDWFSAQRDTLLKAMFRGLDGVVLVDAWEMTLAHRLPHDIHPPHVIVKNMINLLLSYVCPPPPPDKKTT